MNRKSKEYYKGLVWAIALFSVLYFSLVKQYEVLNGPLMSKQEAYSKYYLTTLRDHEHYGR